MAKFDFEKALTRLEQIIDDLESGDLGLDESLKAFEEGVELSKKCHQKLARAEARVKKLVKGEDGEFKLELFDEDETS